MAVNNPGDVVARASRTIAAATDGDEVATAAARSLAELFDATVDCYLYTGGQLIGVGASDGSDPTTRRGTVAVPAETTGEPDLGSDPATVSVSGTGSLVLWTDSDIEPPVWALRSITAVAVDAARQRAVRAGQADRIESLEAETERLSNFASIVAHDLRNPLTIARGQLELAREHGEEAHFEKVAEAHDRLQRIIDHTLTMARQDDDRQPSEPVGTCSVAEDAWGTVDTGAATLELSETLYVSADPERLQQLFENLFRNAVEHGTVASKDGTGTGRGAGLTIEVGTLADERGFFVSDDGSGIPLAERPSVFDLGYSGDGGTGLGLSIVADVADEHGWEVTVTDTADAADGARFEFRVGG